MLKLVTAAATLAVLVSSPALAGDKDKKPVDPSQKIVCRTMDVIGRHIPERVCRTRADWEREASDTRSDLNVYDRRGSTPTASASGASTPQ